MSSREIAERTGKRHDNVMADIRNMLEQLGEPALKFQGYYIGANGKQLPEFLLPKDLTLTLVAGYSAPLRHRIVTRWMELEQAQSLGNVREDEDARTMPDQLGQDALSFEGMPRTLTVAR